MIHTIAHLFRKSSLSRSQFSEYYETRHTHLARRTLPEFSYYRRNHVLESTDDALCPDSFSEFGYDQESKLLETMSILSDARGQALMDDELQFMNKGRNQIYPVQPLGAPPTAQNNAPIAYKTVLVVRGASGGIASWRAAWQLVDPTMKNNMLYSEIGGDGDQQLHWLMGWSSRLPVLAQLQNQLIAQSVPVLWCARVDECIGYPQ
jgi:hypothetical protein